MNWPNLLLVDVLAVLAALFAWRGVKIFVLFVQEPEGEDALFHFYRGAQRLLVAGGLLFLAAGFYWNVRWLLWFGIIFLAEEVYESGVVLGILRWDRRKNQAAAEDKEAVPVIHED